MCDDLRWPLKLTSVSFACHVDTINRLKLNVVKWRSVKEKEEKKQEEQEQKEEKENTKKKKNKKKKKKNKNKNKKKNKKKKNLLPNAVA